MSTKYSDDITKLSSSEIKSKIQREGIWPQYTQRIKSLERTEKEFWELFVQENDSARKRTILPEYDSSMNFSNSLMAYFLFF
ncbi:MAG: hypothetical protein MAG458_01242 [Nitrosopumilus sp.]|nr:hypothetical protein [Nitrosopumilus sp.]